MKARFNFLKLFALSHLTPVQKAHLSYAVRKDIEAREIQRLDSKKRFRQWKLNRINRAELLVTLLSQDAIDLFFDHARRRFGHNDNPVYTGYVIKEILLVFTCEKCIKAVIDDSNVHDHTYCTIENKSFKTLTRMKNQKKLRISIVKWLAKDKSSIKLFYFTTCKIVKYTKTKKKLGFLLRIWLHTNINAKISLAERRWDVSNRREVIRISNRTCLEENARGSSSKVVCSRPGVT
ncbi:hypothetical protein AGLY_004781 [Aphis glycines]|uniref:Uncharacterized protein n=1 Tax=Aphis glycines TaxID=307491 RepID=A0A6G0TX63_APHGL|nr:hypothetical protein AGLY_004781 [Aphis glycines]